MSTGYLQSIRDVLNWLALKGLSDQIHVLLDNGYDDLSAIAKCNDEEAKELLGLFRTESVRASVSALLAALKAVGIEGFREDRDRLKQALAEEESKIAQERTARIAAIKLEDTLAMKLVPQDTDWVDRYCAVDGSQFKWFKSKRNPAPDDTLDLSSCFVSKDPNDPKIITIIPAAALKKPFTEISLAFNDIDSAVKWFGSFSVLRRGSVDDADDGMAAAPPPPLSAAPTSPALAPTPSPATPSKPPPPMSPPPAPLTSTASTTSLASVERKSSTADSADRRSRADTVSDRKRRAYTTKLLEGGVFKKYKHGKAAKRLIWCSSRLDHILWGEDKSLVKGFLRASDITEVTLGSADKPRICLVSMGRTLDLEAASHADARAWQEAFRYLLEVTMEEEKRRNLVRNLDEEVQETRRLRKAHATVLTAGEIFKKWPQKMQFHKSTSVRKLWCTPSLDTLQWGDKRSLEVKGSLLMYDLVDVVPDPENDKKFAVVAKERHLELEAASAEIARSWIDALRFFIDNKSSHP